MTTRRALVTGASGFLGLAVCDALTGAGFAPIPTDARATPGFRPLDVCDPDELDQVLRADPAAGGVDVVVHLAAAGAADRGLVAGADENSARAIRVNIEGFVHVVQAAARHGVRRVVWSSSTTVYGPARRYGSQPVVEDVPLYPTTAYGVTKAACEHLGPILASRLGVDVVSLRLPMVYGPGRWYGGSQKPLVDLADALRTHSPVTVEAWAGPADWVHVADAADALVTLARAARPRHAYHVVGHRGSLADLANALLEAAGRPTTAQVSLTAAGTPDLPAIDDTALRRDTGFRPAYADAAAGVRSYMQDQQTSRRHL